MLERNNQIFRCKYKIGKEKLITDLFVKSDNTRQFLHPPSSPPYHCKEEYHIAKL